jgi:hypothetical protein
MTFVTKKVHIQVVEIMKNKVKEAIEFLILELLFCFPSHGVMEVLRVVFPQYWTTVNYDKSFKRRINVIKGPILLPQENCA